jgi:GH43 family beta-xylosidase
VARYLIEVADPDFNLSERDCGTIKKERKRIAKIVKKKAETLKAEENLWMQNIKYIDSKNIIYFKF